MRCSNSTPLVLLAIILSCFITTSFTTTEKTDKAVNDFSLKNVNGKTVSMSDYKNAKGFIIIFTCNHCPFAKLYQERMNELHKMFIKKGFPVIAISSTNVELMTEDSYANMVLRAKEKKYLFPYLIDSTQTVAHNFSAEKTPHAYVLLKQEGSYIIKYNGAIDDNGAEPTKAKHNYVIEAINELLNSKPVSIPETTSIGCAIKWKK